MRDWLGAIPVVVFLLFDACVDGTFDDDGNEGVLNVWLEGRDAWLLYRCFSWLVGLLNRPGGVLVLAAGLLGGWCGDDEKNGDTDQPELPWPPWEEYGWDECGGCWDARGKGATDGGGGCFGLDDAEDAASKSSSSSSSSARSSSSKASSKTWSKSSIFQNVFTDLMEDQPRCIIIMS